MICGRFLIIYYLLHKQSLKLYKYQTEKWKEIKKRKKKARALKEMEECRRIFGVFSLRRICVLIVAIQISCLVHFSALIYQFEGAQQPEPQNRRIERTTADKKLIVNGSNCQIPDFDAFNAEAVSGLEEINLK